MKEDYSARAFGEQRLSKMVRTHEDSSLKSIGALSNYRGLHYGWLIKIQTHTFANPLISQNLGK